MSQITTLLCCHYLPIYYWRNDYTFCSGMNLASGFIFNGAFFYPKSFSLGTKKLPAPKRIARTRTRERALSYYKWEGERQPIIALRKKRTCRRNLLSLMSFAIRFRNHRIATEMRTIVAAFAAINWLQSVITVNFDRYLPLLRLLLKRL